MVLTFAFATSVSAAVPNWNVSGNWVFDYHYGATVNLHDMTLVQDGAGSLTGFGGAFSGVLPYQYPWIITGGSVNGDSINFTADYTATVACSFTVTGTIASNGSMSGTWTDNCDGNRNGTWATTFGAAVAIPTTYNYSFDTLDNGMPQDKWAIDHFQSTLTITPVGGGCFNFNRVDGGTFDGITGTKTPGGDGTTFIQPGTTGNVLGGIEMTVCGGLIENPDTSFEDLTSFVNTTEFYSGKYFHRFITGIISESWINWGWTFSTCHNGTWIDNETTEAIWKAIGPNVTMGDVSGTYAPCSNRSITGGVDLQSGGDVTHIAFNAHDRLTEKGELEWDRTGSWANHLKGDVVETNLIGAKDGNFVIKITESSNFPDWIGWELKFIVYDGGTPGTKGDKITWQWVTGPYAGSSATEPIVGGNLVVHK